MSLSNEFSEFINHVLLLCNINLIYMKINTLFSMCNYLDANLIAKLIYIQFIL